MAQECYFALPKTEIFVKKNRFFFKFNQAKRGVRTHIGVNKLLEVAMKNLYFLLVLVFTLSGCSNTEPGTPLTKILRRSVTWKSRV